MQRDKHDLLLSVPSASLLHVCNPKPSLYSGSLNGIGSDVVSIIQICALSYLAPYTLE